ncbi:MAG: hypothetical protein AB2810_05325 [Candidatus Thiodiazotropha endolucinida]
MLRRLIILWLILSIHGYGMAVAADAHHEILAESGMHNHALSDLAGHPDNSDHPVDSDHCCHGIIHILGLIESITVPHLELAALPALLHSDEVVSLTLTPRLRPPISH